MKILVTGGNGFIGFALVKRLLADGHSVRCLVHKSKHLLEGLDIEIVPGSLIEPESLLAATEGIELIYHLAGSGRAGDWGTRKWFFEVNAQGTRNILDAAISNSVGRFVMTSSLAVHRFSGHRDADEQVPADQEKYAYGASKAAAERLVDEACKKAQIESVLIRPGVVVFGPQDTTAFIHMAPMLEKGRWTHVKKGKPLLCYSYVDNLVDGLVLAGRHQDAPGEVFIITDDLQISWKDFIEKVIAAFGVKEKTMSFPVGLARLAGITAEAAGRLVRASKPPPITDYRTALVAKDFHFSCNKAKQILGYQPKVALEEGLRRTVEWYSSWKEKS
jgi:2-alkyl-3-oxoalkanoate reductase